MPDPYFYQNMCNLLNVPVAHLLVIVHNQSTSVKNLDSFQQEKQIRELVSQKKVRNHYLAVKKLNIPNQSHPCIGAVFNK